MQRLIGQARARVRVARVLLALGGLAALLACAAFVAPAFADTQPIHGHQIHGVIKSGSVNSGAKTFTVTTEQHGDVNVHFNGANVRGNGHGRGNARSFTVGSVGDLHDGERVVVQGTYNAGTNTFEARRVHVLPAKGSGATHTTGTFVSYSGSTLTLNVNGSNKSFTVNGSTDIRPKGTNLGGLPTSTKLTVVSKDGTTATGVAVLP